MAFKIETLRNANSKGWASHFWDQTKYSIKLYCNTTSLHGFHYITNKHSSTFTRIFFAVAGCCGLILCSYLIVLLLFEHQQQSILTTVRSTAYPVLRVRFPAVTICNFNIVYKDNIKNVFNVIKNHGIKEKAFMNFIEDLPSLIVPEDLEDMNNHEEVFTALHAGGYTTDGLMAELAHPCNSTVKKCFWESEEVTCSDIFVPVKTSHGYCCSFNYYATMNAAQNLNNSQRLHYHVGGAGPTLGLRVLLDIEEEQYTSSVRPSYGLNILVQDGADYPDMDLFSNTLLSAEELTISVTPRIYDASENIRSLNVKTRNCLFEDEGNLQWTAIYSYKTCISECKAKAILRYCNCIPYYYPAEKNIRICTLSDVPCLQTNKYKYNALGVTKSFLTAVEIQSVRARIDEITQCNCYRQCNERMFDFHTDRSKPIQMEGFDYTNMSILNVYYNTVGCIEISSDVYYTWDRVFASVGGVIGLCVGGSLISILECFYIMGRCMSNCKKTSSKVVKPNEPEIYVSDFAHHYYTSGFGK